MKEYMPQNIGYATGNADASPTQIGGLEAVTQLNDYDPRLVSAAKEAQGLGITSMDGLKRHFKKGFTLIELLVVIAIIGTLAAILMPALGKAREKGRRAACVSQMKQIGYDLNMWMDDNNCSYPTNPAGWLAFAQESKSNPKLYHCPSDTFNTISDVLTNYNINTDFSVKQSYEFSTTAGTSTIGPSEKAVFWDYAGGSSSAALASGRNHGTDGGNVYYMDGHAGWLPRTSWTNNNSPTP